MTTAQIQLAPKLVPVFDGESRYRSSWGGRGSSKTRGFALMTAVDGYRLGRSGISGIMLCGREHLNSLDESSMAEVKEAINSETWLQNYYEIGEKFIRSKDGRINYAFTGLRHNLAGVKSKARILRAWIDEAEGVGENAWRTLIPTVRDQGDWWQSEIWATWNPEQENSSTNRRMRLEHAKSWKGVELNWRDNPWFPEVLEMERQEDYENRPDIYDHVWEGGYLTITDAQVFRNKYTIERFEPEKDWAGPYFGLDFGFAQDPTAATQSYINGKTLFIRRDFAQVALELDHTAQTLANAIPQIAMYTIKADRARPESISYLARHGLPQIIAAKKWKGSVEDGVEFLKSFDQIVIHPEATETVKEFKLYSYKTDRLSGDIMPTIIDANNHCIDSLRYALDPLIRQKGKMRLVAL